MASHLLLAITVLGGPAFAQESPQDEASGTTSRIPVVRPYTFIDPVGEQARQRLPKLLPSRRLALPKLFDNELPPLTSREKERLQKPLYRSGRPYQQAVGVHRPLPASVFAQGQWQASPTGERVWRLALSSPDAHGMRLHFTNFHVGAGQLWLHDGDADGAAVFGPYSGDGLYGDGDFWSDTLFSDRIIVEFEPALSALGFAQVPFEISEITHLTPLALPDPVANVKSSARAAAVSCNLDATCYGEWSETAKGVARMVYESDGGSYFCSGTLVATRNRNNIPYFLTADHCISNDQEARTLNTFWFFQSAECNAAPPSDRTVPRRLGSFYLGGAAYERGDGTLLRLADTPPSGVVFQGWDANTPKLSGPGTGIHHPSGSHKRISFGQMRPAFAFSGVATQNFVGHFLDGGGLTQPGSSGSGLYSEPGVLIGQLSHGPKLEESQYCGALPFTVNYGRFANVYPNVKDFLDGTRTDTGGGGGTGGSGPRALTSGSPVNLTLSAASAPTMLGAPNVLAITVPEGAARLEVLMTSPSARVVGMHVRFGQAPVLQGSTPTAEFNNVGSGNRTISITPASQPALRAGTYYIAFSFSTVTVQMPVTVTATVTMGQTGGTGNPPNVFGRRLTSGTAMPFTFTPRSTEVLYNRENGFFIQVPEGAQRLEVRLDAVTANRNVDLHLRFAQDVVVGTGGLIQADFKSERTDSNEVIVVGTGNGLRAGIWFIALYVNDINQQVAGRLTATATGTGPTTPPPPTGGTALTSGQPRSGSVGPFTSGSLVRNLYTIAVPANATRLEIKLTSTDATADVDLYARAGQDVATESGRVVSDFKSENNDSNESIVLTGAQLRTNTTYFIALGVFTFNKQIPVTVTATVETGSTGGGTVTPGQGAQPLVSGRPSNFKIGPVDKPTLFTGDYGFTIVVPEGATRLELNLRTTTPGADVDLYARREADVDLGEGAVIADHVSESATGNESITISSTSQPVLQPGTYFIGFGLFDDQIEASGTITATVVMGGGGGGTGPTEAVTLINNVATKFSLPTADGPTLFNGRFGFKLTVPNNASRVTLRLRSDFPQVDTDLYARFEKEPEVAEGKVEADHSAITTQANETLVILPDSEPRLRPGTYFIAIAVYNSGAAVSGTITASIETGNNTLPPPTGNVPPNRLTSGVPRTFTLPAVTAPTLVAGDFGYTIVVPSNASRFEVTLRCTPGSADVDLYLRFNTDMTLADRSVVADHKSENPDGNESLVVSPSSNPILRAGTYFIGFGIFSLGSTINCTINAQHNGTGTQSSLLSVGKPLPLKVRPYRADSLREIGPKGSQLLSTGQDADEEIVKKLEPLRARRED